MASLTEHLIRPEAGVALLFTPPFDQTSRDPGYISGYPPGLRENGGQYSYAAMWAIWRSANWATGMRRGAVCFGQSDQSRADPAGGEAP